MVVSTLASVFDGVATMPIRMIEKIAGSFYNIGS
jgi:hypothetical protein